MPETWVYRRQFFAARMRRTLARRSAASVLETFVAVRCHFRVRDLGILASLCCVITRHALCSVFLARRECFVCDMKSTKARLSTVVLVLADTVGGSGRHVRRSNLAHTPTRHGEKCIPCRRRLGNGGLIVILEVARKFHGAMRYEWSLLFSRRALLQGDLVTCLTMLGGRADSEVECPSFHTSSHLLADD